MNDDWVFNGSIYREVDDKDFATQKGKPEGKVITRYNGKPAVVANGRVYVKTGEVPGWGKPNWDEIERKIRR